MKIDIDSIFDKAATFAWAKGRTNFLESFRLNQIKSKKWLVHELVKHSNKTKFNKVAVLGSWNAILLYELMSTNFDITSWDFYDIDATCHNDRDEYFKFHGMEMNYNSFEADAVPIFETCNLEKYDLIINTSCEHMIDIKAGKGPLYAITSSDNNTVRDHINCVQHYKDLGLKNSINNILYEGKLNLGKFNRFCVIGYHNE